MHDLWVNKGVVTGEGEVRAPLGVQERVKAEREEEREALLSGGGYGHVTIPAASVMDQFYGRTSMIPVQFPRSTKLATKFVKVHCAAGQTDGRVRYTLDGMPILETAENATFRSLRMSYSTNSKLSDNFYQRNNDDLGFSMNKGKKIKD
ncbi:hypothetical protein G5I_03555 [Acromyrmex echinatior]|uniref:Uncharacterized protein n=1 Tax=Acromyrmex echinatior TaxID=103372 RepID=F4WDA2_ACREC|nr:hypothetical protein G5I_03555 [Acromyrmex echinatior]